MPRKRRPGRSGLVGSGIVPAWGTSVYNLELAKDPKAPPKGPPSGKGGGRGKGPGASFDGLAHEATADSFATGVPISTHTVSSNLQVGDLIVWQEAQSTSTATTLGHMAQPAGFTSLFSVGFFQNSGFWCFKYCEAGDIGKTFTGLAAVGGVNPNMFRRVTCFRPIGTIPTGYTRQDPEAGEGTAATPANRTVAASTGPCLQLVHGTDRLGSNSNDLSVTGTPAFTRLTYLNGVELMYLYTHSGSATARTASKVDDNGGNIFSENVILPVL